jgi:hypothetical protein
MKVCCIAGDGNWFSWFQILKVRLWKKWVKGPVKDDIVTVVGEAWYEGEKYFRLKEWPGEEYDSAEFEPIETEQSEYQEVTYTKIKETVPAVSVN